jgi:hypothetical protein
VRVTAEVWLKVHTPVSSVCVLTIHHLSTTVVLGGFKLIANFLPWGADLGLSVGDLRW